MASQCAALTKNGGRCKHAAVVGSVYCHVHIKRLARPRKAVLLAVATGALAVLAFIADITGVLSFFGVQLPMTPATPRPALVIADLQANPSIVAINSRSQCTVTAQGESLTYEWKAEYGTVPSGPFGRASVEYRAPAFATRDRITVRVTDARGNVQNKEIVISVVQP